MSKLSLFGIATGFVFMGTALAQVQQAPAAGRPSTETQTAGSLQEDPRPATSPTEGTAADRTPPGETPTHRPDAQQQGPQPSTSPTEGTAADRTPPGRTQTMKEAAAGRHGQGTELVGVAVVSPGDAPLGQVVDVVFDSTNQPAYVVISSEGESAAVPYAVANSMRTADKIVIDRSRLEAAPKVKQGEWKSEASGSWKKESSRYWEG